MRACPKLLAALAGLSTSLTAWTATAQEDVLRLSWHAPAGCPAGDEVRAAALENAGAASIPLDADAAVERGDRWRVTLRTRRGEIRGERRIEAESCAALADATALVLALALVPPGEAIADPTSRESSSAATPAVAGDAPPVPAAASVAKAADPAVDPASDPARDRRSTAAAAGREPARPAALALGAWGATDATTLPAVAVGGGGSVAWTPAPFRIEAAASAWRAQSSTVAASDAGARFAMTAVSGSACVSVWRGVIDIAPCAGATGHFVSARGFGATENYDASARWLSADGGLFTRLPLAPWIALRGRLDALVPLARPTFAVAGEGIVHTPPALGLRAALGAELTFL